MPIDFTNRDPNDKNGVYSIKPGEQTGWIETAPDGTWTGKFARAKPKDPKGWREVGYAAVTLNDGRTYTAILDEKNKPISEIGDPGETDENRATAFARQQAQAQTAATTAARNVKSKYQGVFPQGHPRAGLPATITEYESGEPDYVEIATPAAQQDEWHTEGTPDGQGGFDNTRPIMARTVNGVRQTRQLDDKELRSWQNTQQMGRNPGGKTDAEIAAEAEKARTQAQADADRSKPKVVPGTLNTTSPNVAAEQPDGSIKWVPNPNYQKPNAQPISIPGNPRYIWWDDGPGTTPRREKNPDYVKPSKIMPHPSDPTKMVNVTEDDAGNPVILPVDDKTVIKPADLPVLQAQYGQIATGLGALAQDLNSRYARGEITEQQKNTAFTAAHQQAQTQVAEINSILDTSKAIWSGELTQRGQSLNETQSRRGFAQNIFDRAAATGMGIATSAGPGHGKAIAGGVQALMNMGQRYAEGMGGFRESPEVALPPALQQARGIGLPGFGAPGAAPGPPGAPTSPPGPPGPPAPPGEAGGPGAAPPPPAGPPGAGGLPAPLLRPPPPVTGSVAAPGAPGSAGLGDPGFYRGPAGGGEAQDPGFYRGPPGGGEAIDPGFFRPGMQGMGGALQSGLGFGGSPVAAGGGGVYDPTPDIEGMIGDGADPTWAEAVRAAAAEVTQPGYAWQRFQQPASRFG